MDATEIRHLLEEVGELRYADQVVPLEGLLREADALDDEPLGAELRSRLLSALLVSDRPRSEMMAPFTWLVTRFDARPHWWGPRDDHLVLWCFKWLVSAAVDDHRIPLVVLDDLLAGMERRYVERGEGLTPVLGSRFSRDRHVLGEAAARPAYDAWVAAPRTHLSDCEACVPEARGGYLLALGQAEEALDEARPVLVGDMSCLEQPQRMAATMVPALLLTGDGDAATYWHLRGTRTSRAAAGETRMIARHVETAALAGQPERAVTLLEERLPALERPSSPDEALQLSTAGAVALGRLERAGLARDVRGPDGRSRTTPDLRAELEATAREVAAAFDRRNATTTVSDELQARLAAPDLPTLSLGVLGAPPAPAASPTPVVAPTPAPAAPAPSYDLAEMTVGELSMLSEQAIRTGDLVLTDRVGTAWLQRAGTDAAWDAIDALAADRAAAHAVVDVTKDALRVADEPSPEREVLRRRSSAFALAAGGRLAQADLDQYGALHDQRPGVGADADADADAREAAAARVLATVAAAVDVVDAELAAGARPLDPDALPAAAVRGRAAWVVDDDRRRQLLDEALAMTAHVRADSPFPQRWVRAALLVSVSHQARTGDAAACREVLALAVPPELASMRVEAQLQLALVALNADTGAGAGAAIEHVEAAVTVAEERPHRSVITPVSIAFTQWFAEAGLDVERCLGALRRLGAAAEVAGDPLLAATAGTDTARVLLGAGRPLEAAEVAEHWLEVVRAQRVGHRPGTGPVGPAMLEANTAKCAAEASLVLGEASRAAALAEAAQSLWVQTEAWFDASYAANLRGRAHERAEEHLDSARAYGEASDLADRLLGAGSFRCLGDSLVNRRARAGELLPTDGLPAALAAYDEREAFLEAQAAAVEAAVADDPRFAVIPQEAVRRVIAFERPFGRLRRATTLHEAGEHARALDVVDGLERDFAAIDGWPEAVFALSVRASVQAAMGRRRRAGAAWERAVTEADNHDLVAQRVSIAADWATWLDEQGRSGEAEEVWERWGR